MRIKFIKGNLKGTIKQVSSQEGRKLIISGEAILTKDMTSDEYRTSGEKNGKFTQLRTH